MKTLKELCERSHVRVRYELQPASSGEQKFRYYHVRLQRRPNHYSGPHGLLLPSGNEEPMPEDILRELFKMARQGEWSFEKYCRKLNLDTDSRKAHAAWSQCSRMWNALRVFFGDKMYAEFSAASQTQGGNHG